MFRILKINTQQNAAIIYGMTLVYESSVIGTALRDVFAVALAGGGYEAVVLPEDQELAGFVPLLSIAYTPVYVARGTDRVSQVSFEQMNTCHSFYHAMLHRAQYCHGKSSVCLSVTLRYFGHIV